MTRRFFAVDLGASGGKCFAGTFERKSFAMSEVRRFAHEGVSFFSAGRRGALSERTYWNDILLYDNIIKGLQTYSRNIFRTVDSIGIDTWGADGQFVTPDGDMVGKIYCYRDHRLDDMIAKVKARINARRVYRITGIHFQPFNVSNQLLWFMTNRRQTLQPGSVYLPIPSVFYYYLGGIRKVDSSFASVTQLMDARKRKWSGEILRKLGIPMKVMPEIVKPGTVVGRLLKPVAALAGINRAKLVFVGSHDTASAFAAAPVDSTDDALIISSGTWALIGKLIPEPITNNAALAANISNEGGIGNIRFLKNCMGGWLVQELRRIWRIADGKEMSWKEMDDMTLAAPAFTAFINPDDASFYNPPNMETAMVNFCRKTGQTPPKNRGTFMRMVYESLALRYRLINELICGACGRKTTVVHIVGGGSKNIMLNQFTADAFGLPVKAGPEEATAIGNFMVQALGLGVIRNMHEALPYIRAAFPIREYKPRDSRSWQKAYEKFRTICKA